MGGIGGSDSLDSECESDAQSHDAETLALIAEFKALSVWRRIRGMIIMVGIQILQTLMIAAICTINNRLIELCIIAPIFWISRTILKKSYHSDSIFICTGLSCILFYAVTALSIPLKYSMFSCIVWAGLLGYGMYLAALHFENCNIYKEFYNKHTAFNVKTCTLLELQQRCRQRGFSCRDMALAEQMFFYKLHDKELPDVDPDHRDVQTLKNLKCKWRKTLNGT